MLGLWGSVLGSPYLRIKGTTKLQLWPDCFEGRGKFHNPNASITIAQL